VDAVGQDVVCELAPRSQPDDGAVRQGASDLNRWRCRTMGLGLTGPGGSADFGGSQSGVAAYLPTTSSAATAPAAMASGIRTAERSDRAGCLLCVLLLWVPGRRERQPAAGPAGDEAGAGWVVCHANTLSLDLGRRRRPRAPRPDGCLCWSSRTAPPYAARCSCSSVAKEASDSQLGAGWWQTVECGAPNRRKPTPFHP
jgi:hypothetical protein